MHIHDDNNELILTCIFLLYLLKDENLNQLQIAKRSGFMERTVKRDFA